MLASTIIAKKRDGEVLTRDEIKFMVEGYVNHVVPDYQMSAWAMAIVWRGMEAQEIAALTDCMLHSGSQLARVSDRLRVDKHSTGGLGDKTSLILAPLLACFELEVPMLSGRGLGITGGTLDKLESFSGYRCDLGENEIAAQLNKIGCVITGTTPEIAPADRKLYQLRDVTGTVPSIALITASIMCKKLAESLDALVLDVKFGSGAFMRTRQEARQLAAALTETGQRMQVPTRALMSDMNQPLGAMVGNACEVNEAIEVLRGNGPAEVRELTLALCSELLLQVGIFRTADEAHTQMLAKIEGGHALRRFQQLVEAQGGTFFDKLPLAESTECVSSKSGIISSMDGQLIGQAVIELGGGRKKLGDVIDHQVGLELRVRLGDKVDQGQPLFNIFALNRESRESAGRLVNDAINISECR